MRKLSYFNNFSCIKRLLSSFTDCCCRCTIMNIHTRLLTVDDTVHKFFQFLHIRLLETFREIAYTFLYCTCFIKHHCKVFLRYRAYADASLSSNDFCFNMISIIIPPLFGINPLSRRDSASASGSTPTALTRYGFPIAPSSIFFFAYA